MSTAESTVLLTDSVPEDPRDPCSPRYAVRRATDGRLELFVGHGSPAPDGEIEFHGFPWYHEDYWSNPRPVPVRVLRALRDRADLTPAEYRRALHGRLFVQELRVFLGNRTTLGFDVTPVAPSWETRYPAESAAWAALSVWIDGQNLCEHVVPATDRVEHRVYVPLGPLADWVVRSWSAIAYEERPATFRAFDSPSETLTRWWHSVAPRGRSEEDWYEERRGWWARHWIEAGANGSVVPDLAFVRDGARLVVSWAAVASRRTRSRPRGSTTLRWDEARSTLEEFVLLVAGAFTEATNQAVYSWLSSVKPLEEVEAGGTEQAIAYFTGRTPDELVELLGADSYGLLRAATTPNGDPGGTVMAQLLRDLSPGASPAVLESARRLAEPVESEPAPVGLATLRGIGHETGRGVEGPEDHGHEAARGLRRFFEMDGEPCSTDRLREIVARCGIGLEGGLDGEPTAGRQESGMSPGRQVHALIGGRAEEAPRAVLLASPRMSAEWARRFEVARVLGTAMLDPYRGGAMGRASTEWASPYCRRRSGAFAAELLLPEEGLVRQGWGNLDVGAEHFGEIMQCFRVGARTAAWQLWNLGMLSSAEVRSELIDGHKADPLTW